MSGDIRVCVDELEHQQPVNEEENAYHVDFEGDCDLNVDVVAPKDMPKKEVSEKVEGYLRRHGKHGAYVAGLSDTVWHDNDNGCRIEEETPHVYDVYAYTMVLHEVDGIIKHDFYGPNNGEDERIADNMDSLDEAIGIAKSYAAHNPATTTYVTEYQVVYVSERGEWDEEQQEYVTDDTKAFSTTTLMGNEERDLARFMDFEDQEEIGWDEEHGGSY